MSKDQVPRTIMLHSGYQESFDDYTFNKKYGQDQKRNFSPPRLEQVIKSNYLQKLDTSPAKLKLSFLENDRQDQFGAEALSPLNLQTRHKKVKAKQNNFLEEDLKKPRWNASIVDRPPDASDNQQIDAQLRLEQKLAAREIAKEKQRLKDKERELLRQIEKERSRSNSNNAERERFRQQHYNKKQRQYYEGGKRGKPQLNESYEAEVKNKLTSLYDRLRKQIEYSKDSELRVKELQRELSEALKEKEKLRKQLASVAQDARNNEGQIEHLKKYEKNMHSDLDKLRAGYEEQRVQKKQLQSRLAEAEAELAREKERGRAEQSRYQQEVKALQNQVKFKNQQIAQKNKLLNKKEEELLQLKEDNERLEESKNMAQRLLKDDRQKVNHLLQEHANMRKEMENVRRRVGEPVRQGARKEELQLELEELHKQLNRVEGKRKSIEQSKEKLELKRRIEQIEELLAK